MTGIVICLSAAAMGVDYGWKPLAGGGIEYIIQVEPQMVDSLKSGRDIFSDLPRTAQPIRSYRITVGTVRLPHHGEPPPDSAVVTAAGEEVGSAADEQASGQESGFDLSQLPGPVLRPALTLGDPNHKNPGEPEHLRDEREPNANRVAGYHDSTVSRSQNREPKPNRSRQSATSAGPNAASQRQPAAADRDHDHHDAQSPSDAKPAATTTAASKPSVLELGLFASLACNAFLLWVTTGQRSRYRGLVRHMFASEGGGNAARLTAPQVNETPRWEQIDETDKPATSSTVDPDAEPHDDRRP